MADFLKACVKARKSIVVSGIQGAGKTTLVRALCSEIDPNEPIGTFETEYELFLHELFDQHRVVHAWEARAGSGERGPDGRMAGDLISTQDDQAAAGEALLKPVLRDGVRTEPAPTLKDIRSRAAEDLARLPEPLRHLQPYAYPVEIGRPLRQLAEEVDLRRARQGATA